MIKEGEMKSKFARIVCTDIIYIFCFAQSFHIYHIYIFGTTKDES